MPNLAASSASMTDGPPTERGRLRDAWAWAVAGAIAIGVYLLAFFVIAASMSFEVEGTTLLQRTLDAQAHDVESFAGLIVGASFQGEAHERGSASGEGTGDGSGMSPGVGGEAVVEAAAGRWVRIEQVHHDLVEGNLSQGIPATSSIATADTSLPDIESQFVAVADAWAAWASDPSTANAAMFESSALVYAEGLEKWTLVAQSSASETSQSLRVTTFVMTSIAVLGIATGTMFVLPRIRRGFDEDLDALQAHNDRLLAVMRVRQDVMEERADELQRSNEQLEQFASVAAHDLQEPLRMITSYIQLLGRRLDSRLDADEKEFMGFVTDGSARMKRLIEDLLRYAQIGSQEPPTTPTDMDGVFAAAIRMLSTRIQEADAVVTAQGSLPTVIGDEHELSQLLVNLIGNGLKYHREGVPPLVTVSAFQIGKQVEFAVRDNGIGIAPEHHERIFRLFQRLHKRTEYEGTGIGLAICEKIVSRHGGRIWVDSDGSTGTTFRFTLTAPKTPADAGTTSIAHAMQRMSDRTQELI